MSVDFNVDQAIEKIGQLVQAHGQQAVDAASGVMRVNAVETLIDAPVWLAFALAGYGVMQRARKRLDAQKYSDNVFDIGCVWVGGLSIPCFMIAAADCAFSIWSWVALFNPHLALAHEVMQRLGAQ